MEDKRGDEEAVPGGTTSELLQEVESGKGYRGHESRAMNGTGK